MKEVIITSSVLILCIMFIRKIFRGKISCRLQYTLWILVAARLLIPVSAQIPMAIGRLESFRVLDLVQELETRVGVMEARLAQLPLAEPIQFTFSPDDPIGRFVGKTLLGIQMPDVESDGPTSVFFAGKIGLTWLDIMRGTWRGGMIVMALWIVGVNLLFARRLHQRRKEFVWLTADGGEHDVPRGTKLYVVEGLTSPCLYGMPFREAIYLTPEVAEDTDRLRHVLTHEMCHKKHCDGFWSVVRNILLIVYWMNPLVWVAAVLSKRDCELACDEAALAILGDSQRTAYGETLLSIITGKKKLSDIAYTATTMTESGKRVKERIRYIAEKPRVPGIAVVAALLLVVAASVLVFTRNPGFTGHTWEGEIMLTAENGLQVRLPETIAGISGYDLSEDGDIVIYQLASGWEAGRFRKAEDAGTYEITVHSYESDESVPGTDSNTGDTTYIIPDAGEDSAYQPMEAPESVDYLPDETVTTTVIPRNYRYIQGDYTGLDEKYLEEMSYINSELQSAVALR